MPTKLPSVLANMCFCSFFVHVLGHLDVEVKEEEIPLVTHAWKVCGNFNYSDINWSLSLTYNTSCSQKMLDAVHGNCLFQHITKPTRYRTNTTANTLDLVFTNKEGMVARWY